MRFLSKYNRFMKRFSLLSVFIFLIGLCTCVSCGYFISSAVLSSFGFGSSVASQSQKYYAISVLKSDNRTEIEQSVPQLQAQNGAGFIFENNSHFYLLASIYENVNDAELVKTNLRASGIEAEIVEIDTQTIEIKGNFTTEEKNIISQAIKANFEAYKKLYDVSVSLDTGICDKTNAKLECNKVYSSIMTQIANLNSFFKENSPRISDLKSQLEKTTSLLSNLNNETYSSKSQTFSSLVKETYCKILFVGC